MLKLLIGGSPCTRWSIAQTKNRETKPEGLGWELFKNYLIALEKYKPDYFLYENNKSMSPAIRAQITQELGVEPILINSALVSAQNRQRLYWTNVPGVEQPEDRGILLRDILESGFPMKEKGYTLKANYFKSSAVNSVDGGHFHAPMVAEPVRIGTIESAAESKNIGLYAIPCAGRITGRRIGEDGRRHDYDESIEHFQRFEINENPQKTNCLTTVQKDNMIAAPVAVARRGRVGGARYEVREGQKANAVTADGHQSRLVMEEAAIYNNPHGFNRGGVKYGKAPTLTANGNWQHNHFVIESASGKTYPVYEVRDGQITIKGQQYPIKLLDGFYIIRKLTVTECKRLQTVPEEYIFPVSDTQAYKMLGNGWTVDVIAHILSCCPGIATEPLEVLSMYDGMSCGHLALDKLGANVARYYATVIDKYAIQTTQRNYPDTIQLGDAFQVRGDGWRVRK